MFLTALVLAAFTQPAPLQNQALLDNLSQRAFYFFWTQSNPATGLTKDRASNFKPSDGYTVASVASTGYSLAAYGLGFRRGWVGRQNAIDRSNVTLNFLLTNGAKYHGWFYHFVDWATGARVWNSEVSSIDTSILIAGAILDAQALNDQGVTAKVSTLINSIDWNWMLTNGGAKPNSLSFCMGWTPEGGFLPYRWDTMSEEAMLYVQALGSWTGMPTSSWKAINRPLTSYAGRQEWQGGPLFMHEMSQGFLPFAGKRDSIGWDHWVEAHNAVLNSRQFCIDNPNHRVGYNSGFWGLTACDVPNGYQANGGPGWGSDDGTVAPTCAIAGVQFTTAGESMLAANYLARNYSYALGRYGFSNGINPTAKWFDPDVIGIDLGMEMLAIENSRDGLPNALSGANAFVQRGMARAGFHFTNEGASLSTRPLFVVPGP